MSPDEAASGPGKPDSNSRRSIPTAALFLLFLLAGLAAAIAVFALWPEWLRGSGGSGRAGEYSAYGADSPLGPTLRKVRLTRGRLELSERSHDFGEILDGMHKIATINFQNVGSEDLVIREITKPCTCVTFDAIGKYDAAGAKVPIPDRRRVNLAMLRPGERGYLTVRVFPTGATSRRESSRSQVIFLTNALNHERVRLDLQATFLYLLGVEHRRAGEEKFHADRDRKVNLGAIGRTQRTSFWIDLIDLSHERFQVGPACTIDGKTFDEALPWLALHFVDAQRMGIFRKRLVLEFGGLKPPGPFEHLLRIPSTIHGGYRIELKVGGWVGADLHLEDSLGRWDPPLISFGQLRSGEPTTTLRKLAYVGSKENFKILNATVVKNEDRVPFPIEVKILPAAGGRMNLKIDLPSGATRSFSAEIVLETNLPADHPQHRTSFTVKGIVPATRFSPRGSRRQGPQRLQPTGNTVQDVGEVVHGAHPRRWYGFRNPGGVPLHVLSIQSATSPAMRCVAVRTGAAAEDATPPSQSAAGAPLELPLTIAPRGSCELCFQVDTRALLRGQDSFAARARILSDDPLTPELFVEARGRVEYPAGIYAPSPERPKFMMPVHSVWIPPTGSSGSSEQIVHLRPTRGTRSRFVESIAPAPGTSVPPFLTFSLTQREEKDGYMLAQLRLRVHGEKPLGPFHCELVARTNLSGGYELPIPVHGRILHDLVFMRDEVVSARPGAEGQLSIRTLPQEIAKLVLGPIPPDKPFVHVERLAYLGGAQGFSLAARPEVHFASGAQPDGVPADALRVSIISPGGEETQYYRLRIEAPEGLSRPVKGRIVLRSPGAVIEPVAVPFELNPKDRR